MQIKVKNREALLSHGDAEGRKIVLDITEKTLQQLDAYERIKRITHMEGDVLCIGSRRWDLSKKRNVYLLGAGKACNHMAMAIDEILGDHLTRGIAIVKISEPTDVFHKTEVYVGGHPLPNAEGLRACKEIIRLIDKGMKEPLQDSLAIGKIIAGEQQGRTSDDDIICFIACGMSVFDLGLGYDLYETALEKGIGTKLLLWENPAQCE